MFLEIYSACRDLFALPAALFESLNTIKNVGIAEAIPTFLVGVSGFEPEASWTRTKRDTKLRHTPLAKLLY